MEEHYPPIQIVDANDNPLRGGSMDEAHKLGLKHRIVFILVEDPAGRLLLQKRSSKVATYKNTWDVSAAGHVDEGESYGVAAERELNEELGLTGIPLHEIDSYYDETVLGDRKMNRFRKVYRTVIPADTPLKPNIEEVSGIRWLTIPELRQLIHLQPETVAPGLITCIDKYYK